MKSKGITSKIIVRKLLLGNGFPAQPFWTIVSARTLMFIAVPLPTISIDRVVSLSKVESAIFLNISWQQVISLFIFKICQKFLLLLIEFLQVAILTNEKALATKPLIILDVRPEEQFAKGHIIGGLLQNLAWI